jgi:hypothetical protein
MISVKVWIVVVLVVGPSVRFVAMSVPVAVWVVLPVFRMLWNAQRNVSLVIISLFRAVPVGSGDGLMCRARDVIWFRPLVGVGGDET